MAQNNNMVKKGRCLNVGNCNKANTKEIIEVKVGEDFECPECKGELIEVKPSGTPIWMYILIGVAVVAIGVGIYFSMSNKQKPLVGGTGDTTVVDSVGIHIIDTIPQNPEPEIEGEDFKTDGSTTVDTTGGIDKTTTVNGIVTKDLGYAVWVGKMKNGKPHDVQGSLTFKSSHIIDSRDEKKRTASAGDKVIGTFEDGHLTHGKWYKSDGNVESIILGGL